MTGVSRRGTARRGTRLRSPAHGFDDDEQTRRLLRTRPPRRALQWAEGVLGGKVVSTRALRGGTSSAVHQVTVEHPQGGRSLAVLRRYVRPELNQEEPDLARREAQALRFVDVVAVPTPHLLAVDPTGDDVGVPTLLMTRLPGHIDWWPRNMERWLQRLAEVLPHIHAAPQPPLGVIRPYAPYPQTSYTPPEWARHPKVWERAIEISGGPPPDETAVLVQRDFHPGNVLWQRGAVTGVVDWQAASIGPAAVDVGHCRTNLLGFDRRTAEQFTRYWEQASGRTYHPWADVVTIIGFLDDLRSGRGSERDLLEDLLADAVAQLSP